MPNPDQPGGRVDGQAKQVGVVPHAIQQGEPQVHQFPGRLDRGLLDGQLDQGRIPPRSMA